MGSIWLLSGADKPPPKPRKPPAKRPARRGTGAKSRPARGKRHNDEAQPAEKPKPKPPARRATNAYQMEIKTLAEATAALPPDFRDAVVRIVQGAVDLFKRAWRALRSSGVRDEQPPKAPGGPPNQQQ